MWIKKDISEILKDQQLTEKRLKKKRVRYSFIAFGIGFFIGIIWFLRFYLTGYDQINPSSLAPSSKEIYARIVDDLIFTTLLSTIGFLYVYFYGYKYLNRTSETEVCDKCNKKRLIEKDSLGSKCQCGGVYFLLLFRRLNFSD